MKNIKKHHVISFLVVLTVLFSFVFFFHLASKTQAQETPPSANAVSGTAIITNMGYIIYFSGPNANGGSVQYDTSGKLSGYAWSPQYGWLDFSAGLANISPTTGAMTGKAKMLSLQNPNDTESNDTESIEWADGTINFSGINGGALEGITYGVKFDLATGYADATKHWAWGGNVIGWVDFSGVSISPNAPPICTLTAYLPTIYSGNSSTLTWTSTNATSCTASGGWTGTGLATYGTFSVSPSMTTTYSMSCSGSPICSATVIVNEIPTGSHSECLGTQCIVVSSLGDNACSSDSDCAGSSISCGSANGTLYTSAPITNLCSDGSMPLVTGVGPWTWTCGTGSSAVSCSTKKIPHYIED